jgi:orotidine-5'-phosphate decarboxylase
LETAGWYALSFSALLAKRFAATGSLVCLGLDPVLERIPQKKDSAKETLTSFFISILDECEKADCLPNVVKPNIAFFSQYGLEGLHALESVIAHAHGLDLPVILDAKRGDIGRTSAAYATEAFDMWKADAVTIAPYMGSDSVRPFIERAEKEGKGVYVLVRTSNVGATDFQTLRLADGSQLFEAVARKVAQWGTDANGNVGAVVGATSVSELSQLASFFAACDPVVPLLIPGVGAQGGSAADVVRTLSSNGYALQNALINASSSVLYAHEKNQSVPFAQAAVAELKKLQSECGID